MKKGKWIIYVLLCIIFAGCGEKEEEPVEITLIHGWGSMEPEHVRMREIYKDFEKEHPEIKLNLYSMTSPEKVVEKVKNMLSVGEVPDLIFVGGFGRESIYNFMKEKNKVVDLMPYVEEDQVFRQNLSAENIRYWKEEGHK